MTQGTILDAVAQGRNSCGMHHPHKDLLFSGVFDGFPSGVVGNLAGTENQYIRCAELFFDIPFLPIEYFESHSQRFCRFDIRYLKAVKAADQYRTHKILLSQEKKAGKMSRKGTIIFLRLDPRNLKIT
jgi:hypothetical protein